MSADDQSGETFTLRAVDVGSHECRALALFAESLDTTPLRSALLFMAHTLAAGGDVTIIRGAVSS